MKINMEKLIEKIQKLWLVNTTLQMAKYEWNYAIRIGKNL